MFTPKRTKRIITRHEFFVPNDSTAKDLADSMRTVQGTVEAAKPGRGHMDDAFFVRSDDEGVVLWFETEEAAS